MLIYGMMLSIICLLGLFSLFLPSRQYALRIALASFAALLLTGFMGLRDHVGADWPAYDNIFEIYSRVQLRDVFTTTTIEPCYALLNYLAHCVGGDIHLVNLVCAFLMVLGLIRFAYLIRVDACLLLFLATPYLLYAVGMGYTRQAVAIGIGFAALGYWVRGEHKKCYACMGLAICFHYSAVFLFLLIAMKNGRRALLVLPVALLGAFLLVKILLTSYLSLYIQNTEDLHSNGVWLRLAIVLIGVVTFMVQRKRWKSDPGMFNMLSSASALAVFLVPVAVVASTLADRVCLYLFFVYLAACGRAIHFSSPAARQVAMGILVAATYGCFFLWFTVSPYAASSWIPYRSWLFSQSGY
ncbi:MAG TPA: EpsG family protein [Acidisarcina sp.]|nr:EpsG family protein [Acidisarcina sp.]